MLEELKSQEKFKRVGLLLLLLVIAIIPFLPEKSTLISIMVYIQFILIIMGVLLYKEKALLFLFVLTMPLQSKLYVLDVGFSFKPFHVVNILLFLWIIAAHIKKRERKWSFGSSDILLLAFVVLNILLNIGRLTGANMRYVVAFLIAVGSAFLFKQLIKEREQMELLLKAALITSTFLGVLGILLYIDYAITQQLTPVIELQYKVVPRLNGVLFDSNFYAMYMLVFMSFNFFIPNLVSNSKWVLWSRINLILLFINIIFSYSRAGLLALFAALVGYTLFSKDGLKKRAGTLVKVLAVAAIIIMLFFIFTEYIDLWNYRVEKTSSDGGSGRMGLWEIGGELFKQEPITGIGLGGFILTSSEYLGHNKNLHNSFLQVVVEGGILGTILWIVLLCSQYWTVFFKNVWSGEESYSSRWKELLLFALTITAIEYFFLSSLFDPLLYFIIALISLAKKGAESLWETA